MGINIDTYSGNINLSRIGRGQDSVDDLDHFCWIEPFGNQRLEQRQHHAACTAGRFLNADDWTLVKLRQLIAESHACHCSKDQ